MLIAPLCLLLFQGRPGPKRRERHTFVGVSEKNALFAQLRVVLRVSLRRNTYFKLGRKQSVIFSGKWSVAVCFCEYVEAKP